MGSRAGLLTLACLQLILVAACSSTEGALDEVNLEFHGGGTCSITGKQVPKGPLLACAEVPRYLMDTLGLAPSRTVVRMNMTSEQTEADLTPALSALAAAGFPLYGGDNRGPR